MPARLQLDLPSFKLIGWLVKAGKISFATHQYRVPALKSRKMRCLNFRKSRTPEVWAIFENIAGLQRPVALSTPCDRRPAFIAICSAWTGVLAPVCDTADLSRAFTALSVIPRM